MITRKLGVHKYENYVLEFYDVEKISERSIFVISYRNMLIIETKFDLKHSGCFYTKGNKWFYYIRTDRQDVYDYVSKIFYDMGINKQELALDNIIKEYKYAYKTKP